MAQKALIHRLPTTCKHEIKSEFEQLGLFAFNPMFTTIGSQNN